MIPPAKCDCRFASEHGPTLAQCFHRACRWRVPSHWSPADWVEEIRAIGLACACQAEADFDPTRGVPFRCFLYSRIMACTLKRYRQEWKYGFRLVHGLCDCDDVVLVAEETQYDPATVSLRRDWPTEQEVSG